MEHYIGRKEVKAMPMTLGEYNELRGWDMPQNEDLTTEGYLVEYLDAPARNHPDYENYISWLPKDVFKESFHTSTTPLDRMKVEERELEEKIVALSKALNSDGFFDKVGSTQFHLLTAQHSAMCTYRLILRMRIDVKVTSRMRIEDMSK
jgi:hypothetical protein